MVPTTEPLSLAAGDSAQWERSVSGYPPSDGWTLRYYLTFNGSDPIAVESTPQAEAYRVDLAPATTAAWTPGTYHWKAVVSKTGARLLVDEGVLEVLPDPTTAHDPRTHEERALEAITAVLEGRLTESIVEYTVGNTPVKHMDHATLLRLQGLYQAKVRMQRGGSFITQIPVRLTR